MAIDVNQLRDFIIVPALTAIGMWSPSAVNLLLGTAALETNLGTYLVQKDIGIRGGLGIYQCESKTYNDIWDNYVLNSIPLRAKIKTYCGYDSKPFPVRLITDLSLATIITRLYYFRIKAPLPAANDTAGLAEYWKKWYNTEMGSGTVEQFIENYNRYIIQNI